MYVNAGFRFCADRRRTGYVRRLYTVSCLHRIYPMVWPCVAKALLSLLLSRFLYSQRDTLRVYIYVCVYVVPPFSFVAHYAPMNGVRVRVRDSNRHPDHRRHFASVRTVNGERTESRERREHGRNEPFHDNGNSRRT